MKTSTLFIYTICILMFTLSSCADEDSPLNLVFNSPKCKVISNSSLLSSDNEFYKYMTFTVKNTGNGPTAFKINLNVQLKLGNHIVDEGWAYISELEEDESKTVTIKFFDIEDTSNYQIIEKELTWYDAEDQYHD